LVNTELNNDRRFDSHRTSPNDKPRLKTMRLLECNDGKFTLTKDLVRDIPKYAILSHTWGLDTEEVTFSDLVNGTGVNKTGYEKIKF